MAQLDADGNVTGRAARLLRRRPVAFAALLVLAALAVLAAVLGAGAAGKEGVSYVAGTEDEALEEGRKAADDSDGDGQGEEPASILYLDVDGAVNSPGLVTLEEGARVNDAIRAAGGFAEDADTSSVNLAAPLSDGEKLYVPRQGEASPSAGASGGSAGTTGGGAEGAGTLVNINTATLEELDTLPGVGPSTAQAIVEERERSGRFERVEDIMRVSGIGEKKFENLKDAICV